MNWTAQQVRDAQRRNGQPCALDARPAASAPERVPEPAGEYIEPPDAFTGAEKLLHRDFDADMGRRGVHVVHARCDTHSTIEPGLPDFHLIYNGADGVTRACAVEFKKAGGKPSPRQIECLREMRTKRIPVIVAWTLKAAIDFTKLALNL